VWVIESPLGRHRPHLYHKPTAAAPTARAAAQGTFNPLPMPPVTVGGRRAELQVLHGVAVVERLDVGAATLAGMLVKVEAGANVPPVAFAAPEDLKATEDGDAERGEVLHNAQPGTLTVVDCVTTGRTVTTGGGGRVSLGQGLGPLWQMYLTGST